MQHFQAKADFASQQFAQYALRARLLPSARTIENVAAAPVRPGVVQESPLRLRILANDARRPVRDASRLPRLRYRAIADNVVYPLAVRRTTRDDASRRH